MPVVSSDPDLTEFEAVARRHRRGRRARIIFRARSWLISMFLLYRFADAAAFFAYYAPGTGVNRQRIFGSILAKGIWTTALLICIWRRQMWARYVLAILMFLAVFVLGVTLPEISWALPRNVIIRLCIVGVVDGLVGWGLMGLPSIRRYFNTAT